MNFLNITHNLKTFSEEQITDFKIVEVLLNNLNSIKPPHVLLNKLHFETDKFKVVSLGFIHNFLLKDIEKALLGDLEIHKTFIVEEVKIRLKDYNKNTNDANAILGLTSIMKYYSINYPQYTENDDFEIFINDLKNLLEIEMTKKR